MEIKPLHTKCYYSDANINESYNPILYSSNCVIYVGISTSTIDN
jgi:hypothetical protein